MPSAIVTGATGMTGGGVLDHLVKNQSYTKIYALSRSKPVQSNHEKVEHARLDFLSDADTMAKDLTGVSADYVFFCTYMAHDDLNELTRINGAMLSNFLQALQKTGAIKQLKRFILTCGFKHYDVHLGRVKQPCVETDPLLEDNVGGVSESWPSNFYYDQQRILDDASRGSHWDWVCTLPEDVIGFAKHNFMNEATALGLYCAISKVLPGSELPFPGNRDNYLTFNTWTSSNVNAQFAIWAATAPNVGNNIFNVINGDTESFQNLWPKLAERFGCKIPDPMFDSTTTSTTETQIKGFKDFEPATTKMPTQHPLAANAKKMGLSNDPLLQIPPTLRCQIDPEKWATRPDVRRAWETLRDKYGLDQSAWDTSTWNFLTFAMGRDWNCVGSMSKARKFGWIGYADTWDEFERTFRALEREKVLPPVEQLREDF